MKNILDHAATFRWFTSLLFIALIAAACGASDNSGSQPAHITPVAPSTPGTETLPPPAAELKPVTIKILPGNSGANPELFQQLFVEPVKARYPHITIERVDLAQGQSIPDLVATGTIPDIIGTWNGALAGMDDLQLIEDLTPYLRTHRSDPARFQQVVLDAHRSLDGQKLLALPYNVNYNLLYYNKDVFDKFGVPYPSDGLTWADTVEIARKLTRLEDGVQYFGLDHEQLIRLAYPLSLSIVNARTNKAEVNNDSWKKIFTLAHDIYSIPGNLPEKINNQAASRDYFMKNRNVAMHTSVADVALRLVTGQAEGLSWDIAQFPSFPERPNQYGMIDAHNIFLTTSSKHKDEAFQVIDLVTSLEAQVPMVRQFARLSALTDRSLQEQFAAELPALREKNISAIFKSSPAPYEPLHEYAGQARTILYQKFDQVMKNSDINSALREAEEEINRMLELNVQR